MPTYTSLMHQAILLAKQCPPTTTAYNVGAILFDEQTSTILATGYSRELQGNTHAEECCFLKSSSESSVRDLTLITTMEPCSTRLSGKKSCTARILESTVRKVVIGVREPDKFVVCEGTGLLKRAGVEVVYLEELEEECRELNVL